MTYPGEKIQRFLRRDLIVMGDLLRWKKYKDFFGEGGLILIGGMPRSKISQKVKKFQKYFQFEMAFLLMDPVRDFSYKIHCLMF